MARKQRGKGPQQGAQPQRPQQGGGGSGSGGWAPLRDSIRRDVEQAVAALAFAERFHQKMDTQRRAFLDFPRVMEQLRSGAMERLTASLSRLYEGGQGFDLHRFLRDLPLALAQLATADKNKSQPPPAGLPETPGLGPQASGLGPSPEPEHQPEPSQPPAPEPAPAQIPEPAPAREPEPAPAVSPRLELRSRLLAAAPELAKAAATYRRNIATIRRASLPRRSPGPWRADREVLEEARRAVEFVQKLYDTYAEAWADQPLPGDLYQQSSAELDRFLAWTQLDRYVELAVLASTNVPRPPKPGQHVISAPKEAASAPPPVTEASPGAVVAASEPGPATETHAEAETAEAHTEDAETKSGDAGQPVAEPEPGRA